MRTLAGTTRCASTRSVVTTVAARRTSSAILSSVASKSKSAPAPIPRPVVAATRSPVRSTTVARAASA